MKKKFVLKVFSLIFLNFGLFSFQAPPITTMRGGVNNAFLPNQLPSDRRISTEIQQKFRNDYYTGPYASFVQVYTIAGVVTLAGRLDNDRIKLQMEQKAKQVYGVREVINDIEIVHLMPY
ncbi:putative periplasmic or secreted lipoprotein [Candidatus Rubidus massiliensis]|nr:MAG: hypothetical protein BGO10_06280 [Chlamydia sp. 32-24]CDZ81681.1 putative periplasmic or secreted lipoprotein [Candidatus Rubidus massiliensis]